jgi:predicted dehydrogenase
LKYKLGVVGLGHWFERLLPGLQEGNELMLFKAVGTKPAEARIDQLRKLNINPNNYYVSSGEHLPDKFFEVIDIVQIANPNNFHKFQTIQSLSNGKATVTEKTWGINEKEFNEVIDYIKSNNYENKSYLHLHYVHKQLTLALPLLLKEFTKEHGKITNLYATFFEPIDKDHPVQRAWLFSMASGGLFMDWIHPYEIIFEGASADKVNLEKINLYSVNSNYKGNDPTGIHSEISIKGPNFANDAEGNIMIAKDIERSLSKKEVVIEFENGNKLELKYTNSELEFISGDHGTWKLLDISGNVIEAGTPQGPNSSELLLKDMLNILHGKNTGLSIEKLSKIFSTQWQYQKIANKFKIEKNINKVNEFLDFGMNIHKIDKKT